MVQALSESDIQVSLMPEEAYEKFWPQIEHELNLVPQIWKPYFTKDYLREVMLHKELMVWCTVEKGAVLMVIYAQFIHTPRGKGLSFVLALGNGLDKSRDQLEATYERLGQLTECDFIEIRGRRGWTRKFPGFHEDYVVLSRQLRNFRVQ